MKIRKHFNTYMLSMKERERKAIVKEMKDKDAEKERKKARKKE
jgi:hypothetical protein